MAELTEAARYERLSGQVGDRELSRYCRDRAAEIRKQAEVQRILSAPEVEHATQRFMSDLGKAGIQVSQAQIDVQASTGRVRVEAW